MASTSETTDLAERRQAEHREFLSYIWGLVGALALTLAPFALVHWKALAWYPMFFLLGILAVIQMGVHLRFFLHLGTKNNGDELKLVLFTILMLVVMVGGTMWVMSNLAGRMAVHG